MVKKPFFSIVLPTYNQSEFLGKCINSILSQTFNNWELIIINNNSTDSTLNLIKKFKDKRIKTFNINNRGILARSRNLGIRKSKSEWICFIDTDDKWYPKKLEMIKIYIENNDGELFYHDLEFENKKFLFFKKKIKDKSNTITKPIIKYFVENGNPIGQSSVVVKKKTLKKINFLSEKKDKFSWEDFDLWIRIANVTENFVRVPKILGSIWVGSENLSSLDRQVTNNQNIKRYYSKLFYKFVEKKNKTKNLWWLEYPSILKEFRNRNIRNFNKLIDKISTPPIKFYIFIKLAKYFLTIIKIAAFLKKFFSIIIFYKKNTKNLTNIKLKENYKIVSSSKVLKKLKFKNFKIPEYFLERIDKNNNFHLIYKNNNIISYGWSSKSKKFFITEINSEIINNNNVIFFDFRTLENFRKKGFYQKLLKKMLVSFRSKDCFIYTTIFNIKSLKAINKSNFEFVNFFSIFKKKIDLN